MRKIAVNTKKRFFNPIVLTVGFFLLFISRAGVAEYPINQVTNNTYDDRLPQVHNGQAGWMGDVHDDYKFEIFFFDGTKVTQLTDSPYANYNPQIYNGQITWYGYDGTDYEIFFYDGTRIIQLTDNNYSDFNPQINNNQIAWYGYDGTDDEIFFYDGNKIIQLTDNDYADRSPQLCNGQIVWEASVGSDDRIFFYDGDQTIQLTNNAYGGRLPQIHNGQVVWMGWDGTDFEIFLYDGARTIQLSDNTYWDGNPQIHNGQVTWCTSRMTPAPPPWWFRYERDVFFYDGSRTIKLTEQGSYDLCYPQIDNGMVVWQADPLFGAQNREIFFYDGKTTVQLTNNYTSDSYPQIHNGQVVWTGWDGNDTEIFLVTVAVPKVEIVLTFDDGPVGDEPLGSGENSTENILNDLSTNDIQDDIKAAFFIQTHAPDRGGSLIEESLITREDNEDHIVAIHTGGKARHRPWPFAYWDKHCTRVQYDPYDIDEFFDYNGDGINNPDGIPDGENALESDLIAAKRRIKNLTGKAPEFVRPPYYAYGDTQEEKQWVLTTYERQGLKMILTDAKGQEGGESWMSFSWVGVMRLGDTVEEIIKKHEINQIVVTLHDTNEDVAENLISPKLFHSSILDAIIEGVRRGLELETPKEALEHTQFITSGEKIRQILHSKEEWGCEK